MTPNYNELDIDTIYYHILSNNLNNKTKLEIEECIRSYICHLNHVYYNYKFNDMKKHLFTISNYIFSLEIDTNYFLYFNYIEFIIKTIGCQKLLTDKLLNIVGNKEHNLIFKLLDLACEKGCIPSLIVLVNYIIRNNYIISDEIRIKCIIQSFKNSDDRIYKYFCNMIKNDNFIEINKIKDHRENIITNIFSEYIPYKYKARRLKALSSIICIDDMVDHMIVNSGHMVKSNEFINNIILKYYLKSRTLDYKSIVTIINFLKFNSNNEEILNNSINTTYDLLKNNIININSYIITLFVLYKFDCELVENTKNIYLPICIISDLDKKVLPYLYWISHLFKYNELKTLLSNSYSYNKETIFQVLPFIDYFRGIELFNIKLNKCLFILRTFIRKYKKKTVISRKIKISPLLNEMKNIKPTNKINVMRDGTNFYKNQKQMFNNIPPYHIMPGQLNSMSGSLYIREKADGVLVNTLPHDIYPSIKSLPLNVKAEYIESLDLYLVFDINLNFQYNVEDRYNFLRGNHFSTNVIRDTIDTIDTIDKLIQMIKIEKIRLKEFLDSPYTTMYRWYPKAAWKINMNSDIISGLTDFLNGLTPIDNELIKIVCNDILLVNDGLILSPFSGNREMKLKPKYLLSIDLLYKNKNWYDKEGNIMNHIIESDTNTCNNTIWRCYPSSMKMTSYEPREIRYDKIKPNNSKIVSTIISLYNILYKSSYDYVYRSNNSINNRKKSYSNEWNYICKINNNIIKKYITKLPCKNILDLGCGKGKIINYIGNNFKTYYGMDLDVNMLGDAVNHYSIYNNIIFNNIDISLDWIQPGKMWLNHTNHVKYDTVLAINSLQYFNTEIFWKQLNAITMKDSMMVFNLVQMGDMVKYELNDNMIMRNNNTVHFQFKSIHDKVMTEPYIDNIEEILAKQGWKIIEKYNIDTTLLPSYYTWYLVKKNAQGTVSS